MLSLFVFLTNWDHVINKCSCFSMSALGSEIILHMGRLPFFSCLQRTSQTGPFHFGGKLIQRNIFTLYTRGSMKQCTLYRHCQHVGFRLSSPVGSSAFPTVSKIKSRLKSNKVLFRRSTCMPNLKVTSFVLRLFCAFGDKSNRHHTTDYLT